MTRAKKPTQDVGSSSGKRKAPSKKSAKQPATYDDTKFEMEDAWLVYKNVTSVRNIIPERRVLTSDFGNELLGHVIARNQWETFVSTPRVAYVEIVKEFYANIHDNLDNPEHPKYRKIYMRGQYISFSPLVILRYYGLENTETDNFEAATTNLHEVVTSICQGFDHWPEGSITLDYKSLLPEVRTLDKMVSANILPTTHTSTMEQSTLGPRGGKGILTNEPEPAEDESMDEDRPQAATEPTLASISLELREWRNSHAELEAQIRGIRESPSPRGRIP
ncbi:Uncharacterized protein Adt_07576 [Abeliophyllum distichum]|uniref:Putative plant transposon protein domain-containing protein n=1 Tax=Abeliophyllum distichum TaxID=126358 RepID=A0ABD1VA53_9LAMI